MKALLLFFLTAALISPALAAHEKANTVLIKPGQVIYARFAESGIKLKLLNASTVKDDGAQLTLTLKANRPGDKFTTFNLTVVSRFAKDLDYKAQIRNLTEDRRAMYDTYPVVAEHLSVVTVPPLVEEVALFDWKLEE